MPTRIICWLNFPSLPTTLYNQTLFREKSAIATINLASNTRSFRQKHLLALYTTHNPTQGTLASSPYLSTLSHVCRPTVD
eukprot:c38893_g1_i1 orf=56-295(+)